MKQVIFIITCLVFFTLPVNAQTVHFKKRGGGPMQDFPFREKIEQLEKLKLIEVLNLDEETTLRFFARQTNNRNEVMKLEEQKEELVSVLKEHFTSGTALPKGESFESLNKKILEFEKKMISKRTEFVKSLNDLLTEEQISKFIVFEFSFRREIRNLILDKRGIGERGLEEKGGPPR